jgi:hypothetical protein
MYVVVFELHEDGQATAGAIIAATKTIAYREIDTLQTEHGINVWRLKDKTGWCDSSGEAGEQLLEIPTNTRYVTYHFK